MCLGAYTTTGNNWNILDNEPYGENVNKIKTNPYNMRYKKTRRSKIPKDRGFSNFSNIASLNE